MRRHARAAPLGQGVDDLLTDRPFLEEVLRVGDRGTRRADCGDHRREDLCTIQENLYPVAADDGGARIGLQRGIEGGLPELDGWKLREIGVDVRTAGRQHESDGGEDDRPGPDTTASAQHTLPRSK